MSERDVLEFLVLTDDIGTPVWLDGGWGIDAQLGEQTRWHADLDIVIEARYSATLVQHLRLAGFEAAPSEVPRPWHFVLCDKLGRCIDFHLIELDADGNGRYGPDGDGPRYPRAALTASGTIGGRAVRCIGPDFVSGRS